MPVSAARDNRCFATIAAAIMTFSQPYPIGTPGIAWGLAELDLWRGRQVRHRSYAQEVQLAVDAMCGVYAVQTYGEVAYGNERFALEAVRSKSWHAHRPTVLVTGGVHGYETSGVQGALRFLQSHAGAFVERVNLLVVPCVSPWGYERIQRWNFDAIDPNRHFSVGTQVQECAALMRLVASSVAQAGEGFALHMDLHETTDTDETEFGPARAARDGKPFVPEDIPDGFYSVDNSASPQPKFQAAIIQAVAAITHIAPANAQGQLIGLPLVAPGVVRLPFKSIGLCAGITGAKFTCTTEVYPDSPSATPERCIEAQVAAVVAAIGFVARPNS